ncbi:MAG: sodium:glutamate symporter [Bacteroidales bacterium]|nr:sodium:glutamate symporter [Bacteroidales bacterium]MBO5075604.1 sodium:glutamate symporter [Bacteroidales bacterium]
MDTFTPWTIVVDLGIISALMLLGKLIRVKVKGIQRFLIPPAVLAGIMGLVLGPEVLGWLPLSGSLGTYAGILIAFVFAALPFTSTSKAREVAKVKRMWGYSQGGMLLQWGFGGLLGILLLGQIWPLNDSFGITMPAGFCGGHGSAAALGDAFAGFGQDEVLTLAMTSATFGIICSIVIGLIFLRIGTKRGYSACLTEAEKLPEELRTGVVEKANRKSIGEGIFSTISVSTLTFNLSVIGLVVLGGYLISKGVSRVAPMLELPVFSCSYIVGILVKFVCDRTKVTEYVCPETSSSLSGMFTDYLVAFGIASIKISVVSQYLVPMLILLFAGLIFTACYIYIAAKYIFKEYWFEKAMFSWGWFTGTMAMGMALLRIADPDSRSHCVDHYAIAYIFIAPVEIALITFAPIIFTSGYGLLFSSIAVVIGLSLMTYMIHNKKRSKE